MVTGGGRATNNEIHRFHMMYTRESKTIDLLVRRRKLTLRVFQGRRNSQAFVGDEGVRIEEMNKMLRIDHDEQRL